MTNEINMDQQITASASIFLVADVQRSADYYRDALGFHYDRLWGEPPDFCMVWRDGHCVMLSQVADPKLIRPVSTVRPVVWDAYFWVRDAEGLFDAARTSGAQIKHEPLIKPYGVKEFVVLDPDGHQLCFGEEIDDDTDD